MSAKVIPRVVDQTSFLAGLIDKYKIVEHIDRLGLVADDDRTQLKIGHRVKAILLSGLGFPERTLYQAHQQFEHLNVQRLFGAQGICAEDFDDNALGRGLDKIAEYGTSKLFSELAFELLTREGLLGKTLHIDSTSVKLFGQYEGADEDFAVPEYGYSRDKRPDLKQVVLTLVTAGSAGVPLWYQMDDGNQSDKTGFHDTISRVTSGLKETQDFLWVADGALYSKKHLQASTIRWLTRVPGTLKLAKQYQQQTLAPDDVPELNAKNRGMMVSAPKGERWLLVLSQEGRKREEKTLEKRIVREEDKLTKQLNELSRQRYACVPDAVAAAEKFIKSLKWHTATVSTDWHDEKSQTPGYQLLITIQRDENKLCPDYNACGRFILATNDKDLTPEQMLTQYKEQDSVERGFRFLKDGEYRLNHIFLKKNKRIEALMMVLTLGLLIYSVSQKQIRDLLVKTDQFYPNQKRKPIQNPTLRWILRRISYDRICFLEQGGKVIDTCNVSPASMMLFKLMGKEVLAQYALN